MVATEILNAYIDFEYDEETGNYYCRTRLYTPETGRFLSEEPTGINGPNLYWYAQNNPINYIDPDGERSILALFGIIGAFIDIPTSKRDLFLVPLGIAPACLSQGEEELLREERARQDYERFLREQGIDCRVAVIEPPSCTH